MALKETKLVSCGESVKVWDLNLNLNLLNEFYELNSDFICTAWNNDGTKFVSIPSVSSKLILSEFQEGKIHNSEVSIGTKISCVSYGLMNSRYLTCGTSGGEVFYWDTHHSKIEKTFCSKDSEITSLTYGTKTHLAFGTLNGEIYFYNLRNHVATSPMKGDSTEYIRSLDYKKGKLISASDDGTVNLWDANTNKLLQGYESCHQAPAMSVKYMVPNVNMAVSVGLDKKILLFDFRTKKIVKSFLCDQPLRSVDVLSDLVTILAGSSKGYIYFYSTKASGVLQSFQAHKGPIKCLATNKIFNVSEKSKPLAPISDNKLQSVENKPKEINRPAKVTSLQKEDISGKIGSESLTDNYSSSTSSSYEVPLIIQSKEPPVTVQYPTSPDTQVLVENSLDEVFSNNEPLKENPVDDLINYLAANAVVESQLSQGQKTDKKSVEDKSKSFKKQLEVDMEIIVAHVTESIKEAKMEMHMDQMYLFTQMMKQFVDIKEEVKELRERCQANKDMEEELLRLREENRRLKSAY